MDLLKIEQEMTRLINQAYRDPKQHPFYSESKVYEVEDRRGPKGGKISGRKTVCAFCGAGLADHIETAKIKTEPSIWDLDDGNGVYDVPTLRDVERWAEDADIQAFIDRGGTVDEYWQSQNAVPF